MGLNSLLYGSEKPSFSKAYEDEKVKNLFEALDLGPGDAPLILILWPWGLTASGDLRIQSPRGHGWKSLQQEQRTNAKLPDKRSPEHTKSCYGPLLHVQW